MNSFLKLFHLANGPSPFAIRAFLPGALACTLSFGSLSCSNHRQAIEKLDTKSTTGINASDPFSGSGSYNPLTLAQVLASNSDPAGTLDLVGDTSGTFGERCASADPSTSGSTGSSNNSGGNSAANSAKCRCIYSYTRSNGTTEQFETPVIYTESDLVRCKRTGIPSGIASVKVALKLVAADITSNAVTFNLSYGSTSLDLSLPNSFREITRYQCKDAVIAPFLFYPDMYDPILSEDSSLSYPLNYYTGNMGGAIAVYTTNDAASASGGAGWICPTKPNDADAGMDLRLFSIQSDGGSKLIYPPTGSTSDRSTFYLAKASTGAFNVAVNGYIAPNSITSAPGEDGSSTGNAPPLGYGVRPVSTGDGTEACPTDSTIPLGYKWAKLWLFRASIADRKIPSSPHLQQMGYIACNPGSFGANRIVKHCSDDTWSKRVFGTKSCNTIAGHTVDGLTQWTSDGGSTAEVATQAQTNIGLPLPYVATAISTSAVQYVSLDKGISRYDFVFVVTPTEIMTRHFKNATSESLPYTPYRYMTPADCPTTVTDPDTHATCIANANKVIRYGFKAYDVGSNGDAPQNDPARLPVFPVCVLQPQ